MSKDTKHIIDSYKSANIPDVDLESKILRRIQTNDNYKYKFNFRTAIVLCLVIVIASTVVFAVSKIIHNSDGSHTLISETEDKQWTVNASPVKEQFDKDEYEMFTKLMDKIVEIQIEGDEAKIGYFKYSEEQPELFTVLVATDTYRYDETIEVLRGHKDTPDYLYDVIAKLQDDFEIEKIKYSYTVDAETYESLKAECADKSTFGEVYVDVVTVEKKLLHLQIPLLSKDMDKFYNTSLTLSEESLEISLGYDELDYETIMIDERSAMLSKRERGRYSLLTEVDGTVINILADPRGNTDHMIELCRKIIDVLENY